MHWQWLTGPSIGLMAAAIVYQGQTPVYDELARVVGLLVPIVAALLAPLVTAIVFLFRTLVAEMRANRAQTDKMSEVIASNTTAFQSNANAAQRLADGISGINHRIDDLVERIDRVEGDEGARRPRRGKPE